MKIYYTNLVNLSSPVSPNWMIFESFRLAEFIEDTDYLDKRLDLSGGSLN